MDAGTYPQADVKKFLGAMICMKINPETSKPGKKLAQQFDVNSYPRLILFDPKGEILHVVKGAPADGEGSFAHEFSYEIWNAFVAAQDAQPRDWNGMAKNLLVLATWLTDSDVGKQAVDRIEKLDATKEFHDAMVLAKAKQERELLAVKAPAQLKLGKKKEAIESWQALVTGHPDTPEATAAAAELKKLGVKVGPTEAPAKK
jgi:hypothetical protein